ncbi:MAG: glycoside hydrolase family 88 protein [[Clostridium] fimetarium]|nr:glycoside hydrolase family 88 protein [Alistipes timonensis]MCM1406452.1 glycoside hydrolase family 88 protein [[Clostridium] fimetarium]
MKKYLRLSLLVSAIACAPLRGGAQEFSSANVMGQSEKVASYFIRNYPDVGAKSYVGGKERNSKIWTRGVFYEGLMNLYREDPREEWLKYALDWGEFHKWVSSSNTEAKKHNADYQCCGQTYLELYKLDPRPERMEHIKMRIDAMIASERVNYWTWVDAIQMSMPVIALLGDITGDTSYWEYMYDAYMYTRDEQGGSKKGGGEPLLNETTGLWYRDAGFDPPYRDLTEPDKDCYWSRGNGWVYMALARVLQFTPADEPHRDQYINDFKLMSRGLLECQRPDGSWNVSLAAPTNFGSAGSEGPEMTGTSLFVGGMAWGVREGLLDAETYMPAIEKGWASMARAVHQDTGFVGYLQGTGSKPEDGGPITYDSVPDFEDFGYGCWLWGAAEAHALATSLENPSGVENVAVDRSESSSAIYDLQGRPVADPRPGTLYIRDRRVTRF